MNFENDTISIKSKRAAARAIIERYAYFGWKLEEQKDDRFYGDIVHLTFSRPHIIENKDKLQLLQVRLEVAINKLGRLAYKPAKRSALRAALLGLFAAAFIACGIAVSIVTPAVVPIICGVILCLYGVGLIVFTCLYVPATHKREREKYGQLIEEQKKVISEICQRAQSLCAQSEGEL